MQSDSRHELVLAGDVGGTKTNLGIFSPGQGRPHAEVIESFPSQEASGLEELVGRFLERHSVSVSAACFGIAGPVRDGICRTTNLPWTVSQSGIRDHFDLHRTRLVNDLAATAMGVPLLHPEEFAVINEGNPQWDGSIGVVAPGTGLGMALAAMEEGRVHPIASEGGHVDFAPKDELEMDLLRHLLQRWPHVSVERLASGPGLFTIYRWLKEYRGHKEPEWLTKEIQDGDPPRVITVAALEERDDLCVEALDLFVSVIAAAAGNLALTGLTTGGMYLGGGIPPKILPKLQQESFMKTFTAKGRFEALLWEIPVRVILNERTALMGAAHCALCL